MHDPLHRLYRTKILLLAVLLLAGGLALLILGHWADSQLHWGWIRDWPIVDVGSALFTTGLLGVAWQYVDAADSEVRDTERLKRVLSDSAPAMRDAVIRGFAFAPDDLAQVATPDTLDMIATNALAIRLGDAGFASEIYEDFRLQAINGLERLEGARVSIRLSALPAATSTTRGRAALFSVIMRWEYELVPAYANRRFVCTSDESELRDLDQDISATSVWYLAPDGGVDASSRDVFELIDFSVDGVSRPIRRTVKAGSQTYTVNIGSPASKQREPVTVAYTYRTVIAATGNRLRLRVDQPTHGLAVDLDYGDTDLTDVAVLDFIASGKPTRITRNTASVPGKYVSVEFDGWVFPRSGLAFVWSS